MRATLCPRDEDWFALQLSAGRRLTVQALPEAAVAPGSLSMELLDAGLQVLAVGEAEGGGLRAELDTAAGGRHLIRLRPVLPDLRVPLRLTVSVAADPGAEALACAAARELVPEQPLELDRAVLHDRFVLGCSPGKEDVEEVLHFSLPQPASVWVELPQASGLSTLAMRRVCTDPASERACTASRPGALGPVLLEAGDWYVIVETGFDSGPLVLHLGP